MPAIEQGSLSRKTWSSVLYTLRLIGLISYLGAYYIRKKVTKYIREKMTRGTFVGESLYQIHQDTKLSQINRSV